MGGTMSIDKVTAAVRTVTISGRAFKFSPITAGDIGDFMQWYKDEAVKRALALVGDKIKDRIAVMTQVPAATTNDEIDAFMETPDGVCRLLWILARKHEPDLPPDTFRELVNMQNLAEVNAAVGQLAQSPEGPRSDPK